MTDRKSNRGGARPNSGRKPGAINRATKAAKEMAEATGEMPLAFMLNRMRDPEAPMADRMDMAKAAAPYVHSKLSSVDHSSSDGSMATKPSVVEFVAPDAGPD
jgi:hypothetical protein